ncbi:TonB-dependent receptor [Sphingomonas aurantiaca]|uniref:TonB-dependent receptor domain-containing protein n=1 Tax=Sphingomonas aurantiaca TaxID=185949 RepID=UPI002FE2F8C0
MKSAARTHLLATTLLMGAASLATPAFAQVQGDTSGIRAGGATATPATTPGANAQGEVGMTTSEAAPTTENSQGDIVVTGSLIKNPALIASSPVQVIGQEEIQLRQSNTAEDILRTLPGAVPSIGSAVNNGNGGASYVDLRGLGSFRNVVLMDGNRIAPSGLAGRVDLNNIPLALVERVDTLTGGAATTYGADAVSGVVNFITRSDFSGLDASVSNQITERGDGSYFRGDITIGANFDDGRGNAVFSVGYQQSDAVYQGERDYSIQNYDSFSGATSGSGTTTPSVLTLGGRRQINPTTGALTTPVVPFNFNPYNIFQTPFERFNMYGAGHYDVSDTVEVYTRGLFSKNTVETIVAPSGVFGSQVVIPLSNPYLPAAARNQFCAASNITQAQCDLAATASPTVTVGGVTTANPNFRTITTNLSRRTTEAGPRISNFQTTIFDYRAGVKVNLTDGLKLDVSGGYGESENTQTLQGYVLTSRVRSALYATNTTTCLSGAPLGASITAGSGCVPLNVFGADGSIAANQIPYITGESTTTIRTSLAQARAVLNGDFGFASPFATDSIGFAAGAEYRKYRASQRSDTLAQTSGELGGAGGAAPNIDGGYEVSEGFGELIAPLVQDRPFFQSLTLEAGVRYSHYKVFTASAPTFNTTTYKAGGSWEPANGLKFRGMYQRAVRAPNISELFAPPVSGLTNLSTDPCASFNDRGERIAPTPTGNLAAICVAQGAPASQLGLIQTPTSGQAVATSGGNPNLRPEKSDSITAGVVIQPQQFLPGFSVTVDYYNIKIKRAITTPTPDDIINACFVTAPTATSAACTAIRREPVTGALSGDQSVFTGLPQPLSNLGMLKTDGIDLGVNYRTRLVDNVKLALSFTGNYTHDSKFQATPTSVNRECTGYYSVNCASIQPKFSWTSRATFSFFDNVDLSVLWRHVDKVRYEPLAITSAATTPFSGAVRGGQLNGNTYNFGRIPSYDYIDLTARIGVAENFDFTITAQNLFDKQPPIVGSTVGSTLYNSGNTYPSTYDALGRRFAVGARLHF